MYLYHEHRARQRFAAAQADYDNQLPPEPKEDPDYTAEVDALMAGDDAELVDFYGWANNLAAETLAEIDMGDNDCTGLQIILALVRGDTDKAQRWAEKLYEKRLRESAEAQCKLAYAAKQAAA